jgi:two-component system, OmpR family, heavy metal sensor histidine kinase CusS
MLARSFRFRIALLSTLLSGVVLLGFGIAFLAVIRQVALDRLDREIRSLGENQLRMSRGGQFVRQLEESLRFVYGEEAERQFVFEIERGGEVVYRSPGWPSELSKLEKPTVLLPPPGRDGRRRPPRPPGERPGPPDGGPPGAFPPHDVPLGGGPPIGENGRPLFEPPPWERQGGDGPPPRLFEPSYSTVVAGGKKWRCGVVGNERRALVRIGVDLSRFDRENAQYRNAFLVAFPLALLLLAGAGFWLAQRALRPIGRIAETAARINARGLSERIPELRSDEEFERLVEVMNGMLERLERSFNQASRFAADAAHELKTPLTILQGQLEQALQEAPDGSADQQVYGELLGEVQRLRSIVRKLLLLAQADAGHLLRGEETVDWSALVEQVAEDTREAAPALEVRTDVEQGIAAIGDADLLMQLLHNLAGNAVKFCRPPAEGKKGAIEIRLESTAEGSLLLFANTAAPLPPAELERIFERFYRGDPSRNRRVEGVGLGLALCREIAAGHGGDLRASQRPGWIRFELKLPRAPAGQT